MPRKKQDPENTEEITPKPKKPRKPANKPLKGELVIKRPPGRRSKAHIKIEEELMPGRGRPTIKVLLNGEELEPGQLVKVPSRVLDLNTVISLIERQCTSPEVAAYFRISNTSLYMKLKEHFGMTFSELKELCEGAGKASLRGYQFNLAKTNASMAIKLGEIYLGQKSEVHNKLTIENDVQLYIPHNGRDHADNVVEEEGSD